MVGIKSRLLASSQSALLPIASPLRQAAAIHPQGFIMCQSAKKIQVHPNQCALGNWKPLSIRLLSASGMKYKPYHLPGSLVTVSDFLAEPPIPYAFQKDVLFMTLSLVSLLLLFFTL